MENIFEVVNVKKSQSFSDTHTYDVDLKGLSAVDRFGESIHNFLNHTLTMKDPLSVGDLINRLDWNF